MVQVSRTTKQNMMFRFVKQQEQSRKNVYFSSGSGCRAHVTPPHWTLRLAPVDCETVKHEMEPISYASSLSNSPLTISIFGARKLAIRWIARGWRSKSPMASLLFLVLPPTDTFVDKYSSESERDALRKQSLTDKTYT